MDALKKKIKSATLMETLMATTIIFVVFVIASLILNNTFRTMVKNDTFALENRLELLHYQYIHKSIHLPYYESFQNFEITIQRMEEESLNYIIYSATKKTDQKQVKIRTIDEQQ